MISKNLPRIKIHFGTVVNEGTGSNAKIEGYKLLENWNCNKNITRGRDQVVQYIASFAGFAQRIIRNCSFSCCDPPEGVYFGGQVAAPVFKNVVLDTLRYLGVPPEVKTNTEEIQEQIKLPDVKQKSVDKAIKDLKTLGLKPRIEGEGDKVISQLPPAGTNVTKNSTIVLYTQDANAESILVPDLKGATIREAGQILEQLGLQLAPQGSGLAVLQDPEPGTKVEKGSLVKVKFS